MRAGVALAVTFAVFVAGCGGGANVPPLPEGRFLAASQSVTPQVHLYGDSVQARIDVIVDRDRYDPLRVRVITRFEPYEREGEIVRTQRDLGRYTHLRYVFNLRCTVYECLEEVAGGPPEATGIPSPAESAAGGFGERKSITFDPARVVYDDPKKGTKRVTNLRWPPMQSVSRLNYANTGVTGIGFPFEASVTPLHEPSFRVDPTVLGAGFLAGALGLAALAAALVAGLLRREPEVPDEETVVELTPLERALELVEWARARSEPERREALEALAVELEREKPDLVRPARRLAWSSSAPSAEAIDELIASVREGDGSPA